MKRRMIVSLLALFAVVFPTLRVDAGDLNDWLLRESVRRTATQAGKAENKSRRNVGLMVLGLGAGVFVFGAEHVIPVNGCPRHDISQCSTTRDARVFVSGAVVASVGAWLLWKAHPGTKPNPPSTLTR